MSLRDDQLATLKAAGKDFDYYNIANLDGIDHLPYSLKVLVENLVRNIDGANITDEHVKTLLDWDPNAEPSHEIQFTPSRVIMQDFTGVPCIVDLATMRDAVKELGGDPEVINPQVQSDMVIDHSVQIDKYGIANAVGLDLKLPDAQFAAGGINPGYAPGHDSILALTSPGEAWMVPEWVRAVGAGNIHLWNRMARSQGAGAVRRDMGMQAYKDGGIVGKVDLHGIRIMGLHELANQIRLADLTSPGYQQRLLRLVPLPELKAFICLAFQCHQRPPFMPHLV